jgi:DNA polymerase-3 subunit beta
VSTDGHRLAQSQVTAPDGMENFSGIIIPKKTVAEMARLLDKVESSAHVEVSDTKIRLTVGDVILVSKLIDGTFPDYDRVIPKANDKKLTVSKADLRQTVDRVATIASERGRAVKLTCAADKMTVSCHSPDQGAATEDIAAQYQADAIEIGFNSRYLLDLAAHLGDGEVEFEFADPGSPTLLRSVGELDTLFVLMPMRV